MQDRMMKAAIYKGIEQIEVERVPIPKIGPRDALLKVKACAICGSDIKIFHNGHSLLTAPGIMGHEFSGEIVDVGEKQTVFQVGDRVSCGCDIACGICESCLSGAPTFCATPHAFGHNVPGGFAEYCLLPEIAIEGGPVHKIPDSMSFEEAALAEPVACMINGLEQTQIELGDMVVIIGAGAIGCMMIEAVRNLGARKVIMVQRSKNRMEAARKFGADAYICSMEEDPVQRVLEETGGRGANVVITANPSPECHVQALQMTAIRGRICLFGGMVRGHYPKDFDTNMIHYKELTVVGAHGSNTRQHQLAVNLIAAGKLRVKDVITKKFSLEDIKEAFTYTEEHNGLRNMIIP